MFRSYRNGLIAGFGLFTALVLCLTVAWAADILTVDKDGTIRLRVSDTGKVTLNTNEPAQGDLRFTARSGDPTAPLEGDLWYNATDATIKAKAGTDIYNLPGKFTRYSVAKSDADFTTTSTSWADVTGLSITFTTDHPNQVIMIASALRGHAGAVNAGNRVDFSMDGSRLSGSDYGIAGQKSVSAGQSINLSCSYMHVVASAGSHTITVQTFADSGVTNTIQAGGSAGVACTLQVLKFY